MNTIKNWFTPDRRQQIQLFFGALAPLAILAGFGTEGQWEQWLIIVGAVLQFVSSGLSLVNVRDVRTVWAVVRGAVYALAATVSPALVLLGVYGEEMNGTILIGLSLGLGALSNLLAIFIGKQQELDNAVRMAQGADGTWRAAEPAPVDVEEIAHLSSQERYPFRGDR